MSEPVITMPTVDSIAAAFKETAGGSYANGGYTVPKTFAEDHLPEGLTKQQVASVHAYRDVLISGVAQGLGELGLEEAKKDKELKKVTTSAGFFGDRIDLGIQTKREFPNIQDRSAPPVVSCGIMDARYLAKGSNPKAGSLKPVAQQIRSAWATLAD